MPSRRDLTVRVLPLTSDEAGDARMEGTVAERLAVVAELTRRAWQLTRQPIPKHSRNTMPVAITTLADQK